MKKKVRYIDPSLSEYFSPGHTYEVEKETEESYYIQIGKGEAKPFYKDRFEVVPEPPKKKVKCIDANWVIFLELNKVYEVQGEDEVNYFIKVKEGAPSAYSKNRFEVIDEPRQVQYYEVIKRPPLSTWDKGEIITNSVLFEECSQNPDYFKPVYKEQFKAGDWVTIDDPDWKHGIVQLTEVTERGYNSREHGYFDRNSDYGEKMRLATPEEIEKSRFKKGEWVYIINDEPPTIGKGFYEGKIGQYIGANEGGLFSKELYPYKVEVEETTVACNSVRLATQEEIESATSVSIGGYEMKIFQGDKAIFSNYTFTRKEIKMVRHLIASCINAEIIIRGEKLTVEKIDKILNKLK